MLKGIHPAISPPLLSILSEMGHGDEILFSDAHFPAYSFNKNIIRCDGVNITTLLSGVMPLFELDQYVEKPIIMMKPVEGDTLDPSVENKYCEVMPDPKLMRSKIERIERFSFYDRAKLCRAVVVTGETAKYGNIILKKGVIEI